MFPEEPPKQQSMSSPLAAGSRLRIRTDPGRVGVFTGRVRQDGDTLCLQMQFPDLAQYVPLEYLEVVPEGGGDPLDLLDRGRFARPRDLRRTLTHARLTGRLANVIYSMDTTGTDFYAYQFKPLVKLLNSATTGILIADEVGLGKTIEAGLIWTEFRSRFGHERLLVLCPAMLREKWRRELRQRFGVEGDIVDARLLLDRLRDAADEPTSRFALIASLQGTRPRRRWNPLQGEESQDDSPGSRLARLLDSLEHERPLINLTIIDEAHYLRNPETMTAELGRLVRAVSEHIVLLSATPVHLKSQDLYELVHLADPATFNRPQAFDDVLAANEPLVRARDLVIGGKPKAEELRDALTAAAAHPLLLGSRQLRMLLDELPGDQDLLKPEVLTDLAWRLETANLLGHVVTRTRKREVTEWRVLREPIPEAIPLSPVEREFYDAVTDVVRDYCDRAGALEGFLLVTPQRQMSSSMPAAYRDWSRRAAPAADSFYEDLGDIAANPDDDEPELGPLVRELADKVRTIGDYPTLCQNDSKYHRLRARLKDLFADHPTEKVVVFSYFRETLAYLKERLGQDGIEALVVHGGVEDKDAVVEEFRSLKSGAVLLSSEVASEGIDLQFAWVVVNYDLPWNPMRVEQRIGRLDRLGQASPKVVIWNLFYDGTIDARIYRRLYVRLRLFERAVGGLEPILGDEIRHLTLDLFRQHLTPSQEEARIEQTRLALENNRAEEERLEDEAAHLVAYGDYIVNQIHAARELSRRIDGMDLSTYTIEFFKDHYSGCDFRQLSDDLEFEVTLSMEARHDLDGYMRSERRLAPTQLTRVNASRMKCRFANSVVVRRDRAEVINQLHPVVRFVNHRLAEAPGGTLRPAVAGHLARAQVPGSIASGTYAFSIQRWSMSGLQEIEHLHYSAARLPEIALLASDDAEMLVNLAAGGEDWLSVHSETDQQQIRRGVQACLDASYKAYERRAREMEAQNVDRVELQLRTLSRYHGAQMESLERVLAQHRALGRTGLAQATEGRIRALTDRVESKRREIETRRSFRHRSEVLCVGVIEVS